MTYPANYSQAFAISTVALKPITLYCAKTSKFPKYPKAEKAYITKGSR